jgi:F-type H+-transporting ATPase subunit b
MPIDWFTVGAQLLNFLVLVGLLKRFLYGPILNAIDTREKRVADELADAEKKRAEADAERAGFQAKSQELDGQRHELMVRAKGEAAAERRRLVDEARADADAVRAKRNEALEQEYQLLMDDVARRTREQVFEIARKTLGDLAGTSLEQRMCEVFAGRLHELDGDVKAKLLDGSESALIRSAFELTAEQQDVIRQVLNESFATEVNVRFETMPELVSGIEFLMNGRKAAWSISDYLASMEQSVGGLLQTKSAHLPETS